MTKRMCQDRPEGLRRMKLKLSSIVDSSVVAPQRNSSTPTIPIEAKLMFCSRSSSSWRLWSSFAAVSLNSCFSRSPVASATCSRASACARSAASRAAARKPPKGEGAGASTAASTASTGSAPPSASATAEPASVRSSTASGGWGAGAPAGVCSHCSVQPTVSSLRSCSCASETKDFATTSVSTSVGSSEKSVW
nr:hypothetical protein [Phycisphaera mikurensis]